MTEIAYIIGYSHLQALSRRYRITANQVPPTRPLPISEAERASVWRLWDGRGTDRDLETCAHLLEAINDTGAAEQLREMKWPN